MLIYRVFDFIDQGVPIEEINTHDDGIKQGSFKVFLRLFQIGILYGTYFVLAKAIQFLLSLIISVDINDVAIIYFALPILFFIEVGKSKLNSARLSNVMLFLVRSFVKFSIIYAIDLLI
ncbi:hypothetical protein [Roseivirga sp.]|uniref:hypothetical protein n=1 Tax=Roseivirga sp. TaxID=1964215 RepID=UPI002B26F5CA|nr:hypothetical protein [Roseivirga sp.]